MASLHGEHPAGSQGSEYWDGGAWISPNSPPADKAQLQHAGAMRAPSAYPRWVVALTTAAMLVVLASVASISAFVLSKDTPAPTSLVATGGPTPTSSPPGPTSRPTASATAKPAVAVPTKRPVAAPVRKLTGTLGGQYCPVAYLNQNACWHGTLANTGPRIGKLAFIFVVGGGYTNWFATHSSPALSGFYTTPGCVLDAAHSRMVCGAVATGGRASVYISADTSKTGTFRYAVKVADISGGTTVYVDQNSNGTHQVISWSEVIN